MKNKSIIILFSAIFSFLLSDNLYSQSNSFPKKFIIDNTEIIAITPIQLSKINGVFVERDGLKVENDSLMSIMNSYKELTKKLFSQSESKDSIIDMKNRIIVIKDMVIEDQSFKLSELSNKNKRAKLISNIAIGGGVTLSILGILMILSN
mgnify:FL=1|jgi:hypothetical protein